MTTFVKSSTSIRQFSSAAELETFLSGQFVQKKCEIVWVDFTANAVCIRTETFTDAGMDPELLSKYGVEL
ncbi:MAG: hypothetical protein ABI361_02045 [Nitrososphaera sp.]